MTVRKIYRVCMVPFLMVMASSVFSQNGSNSFYFCRLNHISGEVKMTGLYREQERTGFEFNESQKSSYLSGGILLRTNSSILHPNFLDFDLDAGYMPEKQNDKYLIIPDQAEVRTLKKINATATFFKQKKINLAFFGNYDENFSTRENLTNIQSTNIHFGSSLGYNNKVLPFQIDLHSRKWVEEEIQTKRTYKLDQKIATIRLSKSLGRRDRNEFSFNHDENVSINQNALRISNTMDMFDFTHHLQLDSKQKYNLSTYISNLNQSGNLKIKRFMASETVTLELPFNLSSHNTYSYYNINQPFSSQQQNSLNSSLQHKLYKSLVSRINFNLNHIEHTVFKELNTKSGFELNYSKKIPTGQVLVSYRYDRYHFRYESDPVILNISNEQYSLTDGKITLLRLSGINAATVLVKDITGTLIFLEGVDYIIIQQNNYIEVRRIPGGAISNGGAVLIDYSAQQAGNYSYDANMHSFNTDVYILNNKLAFYYRFGTQDYLNLVHTGQVTLNYFTQHISGIRVDFDFVNAGVEYEVYKSSILPYNLSRYYVNFQKGLGSKLMFTLNGNLMNYVMLNDDISRHQKYMDVTAKCMYNVFRQTHLNLDLMYRKQTGQRIDLDLLTAKAEINSVMNKLMLTFGAEIYKRNYVGESINFKGAYVKIIRKF